MKTHHGFTLIELLAVMAIIVIMLSFAGPMIQGGMKGTRLTQAGQLVTGQLELVRREALTHNRSVEVRFYKCAEPSAPAQSAADPQTWRFRALQLFVISEGGTSTPLGKMVRLPQGVIIDSGAALSSILDPDKRAYNGTPSTPITAAGTQYGYFSIRFRAGGSTDLSPTSNGASQLWHLTLHDANDGDNRSVCPSNFWTIQIDPMSGTLLNFRPS